MRLFDRKRLLCGVLPALLSALLLFGVACTTSDPLSTTTNGTVSDNTTASSSSSQTTLPRPTDYAGLVINEVLSNNETAHAAPDGEYWDVIELYNGTDKDMSLAGVGLSDDSRDPFAYRFPEGAVIRAGGHVLVYAAGKGAVTGAPYNAPFKLSSPGETLYLSQPDGRTIDQTEIPALSADTAYGRREDGDAVMAYLTPTPGTANGGIQKLSIRSVSFSHDSGFYDDAFYLSADVPAGYSLYYTTDASLPGTANRLYTAPLFISDISDMPDTISPIVVTPTEAGMYFPTEPSDKATVLRFVLCDEEGHVSDVKTLSFFVGFDQKDGYENLSVISLVSDPDNLFDSTTGIFVNGNWNNRGDLWERPATLSFFDEAGNYVFSQDCGIRIHGSSTRAFQQKSLSVYAREKYDGNEFRYTFFDGVDYLKSFYLRYDGSLKFHEAYLNELAAGQGFATAKARHCAVFLDGEYYGIYTILEKYTKQYVETHYGIDRDNVVIIKKGALEEGVASDLTTYNQFISYICNNNMSVAANYARACELMDMDGFVDYLCFQIWCGNEDWSLKQNIACFRARTVDPQNPYADGKWRFMLYDLDFCIGIWSREGNYYSYDTDTYTASMPFAGSGPLENPLVKSLWKSSTFRYAVAQKMAELSQGAYAPERAVALLATYEEKLAPNMANYYRRFGNEAGGEAEFRDCMAGFAQYFERRPAYILGYTWEHTGFDLSASAAPTVAAQSSHENALPTKKEVSP